MKDGAEILNELQGLMTGYWLTDFSNFSAHLFYRVPNINWIGFYLSDGTKLRLGPFAGRPACVEIAFDRGVCGTAFRQKRRLLVSDVHQFPGHIACDPTSRSELVLPIVISDQLLGVLDVDSPLVARFSEDDALFFQAALEVLTRTCSDTRGLV